MVVREGTERQVHAELPRELRRQFWQALAWREETFKSWLIQRVAVYVSEVQAEQQREKEDREDARTP